MIQETVVDKSMNRLLAHFGPRVVLRPPASATDLGRLEALVGTLPRDYSLFLMTCNGLRVGLPKSGEEFHLCGIHDAFEALRTPQVPSVPAGFVPLSPRSDGCTDWLVLAEPSLDGAVLRWTPGMHGGELLSSSFGHYFDNWTNWLTTAFDRAGMPSAKGPQVFDADYCANADPAVVLLRRSRAASDSLAELELRAAGGDDFE